ncbi:UDP-N-acetylmuramoyl-L-alanine--D-glutamate ligase [Enterobacteriaceae endosymbiont of Macroplea mutica]|uniref:UDP-N-acetylmuramoyl-L-alanine--D-glutamate ligase n=1 Tax=Enterobacteriaceae endosymbiont of Macroplea mutica TaxID=2675791 RepID=UPI00144A09BB|nr:UDP-N-acetylmuramoyl-L-alanine--D-glutamate ligase [Enterobacteriaceae endosymbiont of Macroplea mutica]QJC31179.1 UDP-N-acetylmuramoyl-L-alanine--D-glutamate ligase [Enterobacteriaceae endosymbiont of Macroplea mutica]
MTNNITLIIGLGTTGLSCINFLIQKGIIPYVIDQDINPIYKNQIPKFIPYCFGIFKKKWILNAKLIIISPGVSIFHPLLQQAKRCGINIIGDIELFCLYNTTPVVAITGTNGKSTIIKILKQIIDTYKYNIGIGGNIGYPALNLLSQPKDFYILEISSFQLETIKSLQAYIAVILNITEDHIDRYPLGFSQYCYYKSRIYNNSQTCIYNIDDIYTYPVHFNKKTKYITFGKHNNSIYQLFYYKNNMYLKIKKKIILNFNKTKLIGIHNYLNALTVMSITDILNISRQHALNIIKNFTNNQHTLQIISKKNNVTWINDSKSTNVYSTIAALKSLSNKQKIWLLLGGYDKNCNLYLLKEYINKNNIIVYCFGLASQKILSVCPRAIKVQNMSEAIKQIYPLLCNNDVVLLSPACSSIDQFKNFKQRGQQFINIVNSLI